MDTRVAILSVIVENTDSTEELNSIIHEYSRFVVGRMGIPYHKRNINIISLVVDAPQNEISSLSGRIGRLAGVTAKAAYAKL
ncbi:MAG: iron-only hydrogenase system regulator [Eubacterium sp.]|nr:iron-only hydrogenase system regulator [Eubacterium sp.]